MEKYWVDDEDYKKLWGQWVNGNNRNGERGHKGSEKDLGDRCKRKDAKVDKIFIYLFIFIFVIILF